MIDDVVMCSLNDPVKNKEWEELHSMQMKERIELLKNTFVYSNLKIIAGKEIIGMLNTFDDMKFMNKIQIFKSFVNRLILQLKFIKYMEDDNVDSDIAI